MSDTKVVPFPVCVRDQRDDGGWWYAGKNYSWIGEVEQSVTDREWRRIYERDMLRHVREMERGNKAGGGGNAA